MNKNNAAAAGIAILSVAAASAVSIAFYLGAHRKTPDFIYPKSPSALISTTETGFFTEDPSKDIPTVQAAAPSESAAEETQEALVSIIGSDNPRLRIDITLDGFDIIIEGECESNYIRSACLFPETQEEKAVYDGNNYRIVLKDKHTENDYETIYIYASDGTGFGYRVRSAPDGFEPLDTSDIAENNLRLAENPIALPTEGVLQYITPDGDPIKAREVMEQVEEISDKICAGKTDDYDKAFAISEWIAENIYYDFDASHSSVTTETLSLSHILEVHRTVCGGFSNLFSALCAVQGIEVRNMQGEAVSDILSSYEETDDGALHEWNYAVINGRGVWVDTTWNTYNYYQDGRYNYGGTCLKYFDVSNVVLSYNHRARICQKRDYYAALE